MKLGGETYAPASSKFCLHEKNEKMIKLAVETKRSACDNGYNNYTGQAGLLSHCPLYRLTPCQEHPLPQPKRSVRPQKEHCPPKDMRPKRPDRRWHHSPSQDARPALMMSTLKYAIAVSAIPTCTRYATNGEGRFFLWYPAMKSLGRSSLSARRSRNSDPVIWWL